MSNIPPVIVTRPQMYSDNAVQYLLDAGLSALSMPALELQTDNDTPLIMPDACDLAVFVSGFAFLAYWQRIQQEHPSYQWPAGTAIAVVGQGSLATIQRVINTTSCETNKQPVFYFPDLDQPQDSEHLWLKLPIHSLKRVLIVRGQEGRNWLAHQLQEQAITVLFCRSYVRKSVQWNENQVRILKDLQYSASPCIWWVTSKDAFHAMYENICQLHMQAWWWQKGHFWVIHPRIQEEILSVAHTYGQASTYIQLGSSENTDFLKRLLAHYE